MDIQSNSQQESYLTNLKNKIRCMCNEHDTERLLEEFEENRKIFGMNSNKYAKAILESIEGKDIKSAFPYIKKVAWTIANEKHSELGEDYLPNFTELHLKLIEIGMTGEEWEKYLIDEIITHCLKEFPIELEDMLETIRAIVDYCQSRKLLTFRDYIRLLLRSKVVSKCNIPLPILEEKAKTEYEEFVEEIKGVSLWKN